MLGQVVGRKYQKQFEEIKETRIFKELRPKKELKSDGVCHICKKPAKGGKDCEANW